ncbi:MAG TPA: dienelactone hydrolase family protein [Alphaproteobacteria bacterium]
MGKMIKVKIGARTMGAYLAVPRAGKGPGLVLAQEIFGINHYLRDVADLFAEEGYTVLVPDLFWRLEPGVELSHSEEDFKKAFALFGKFDVDQGVKDIAASVKALKARRECTGKVGVFGYCLGGLLAYLCATRIKGLACVAGIYGVQIEKFLSEAKNLSCPLALHFGETDHYTPPEVIAKIRKGLAKARDVEIHVYPGCGHGFCNPTRDSYNKAACAVVHSRLIALFRRTMGPSYDLNALWEQHLAYEFTIRDVDANMKTMVDAPYVNHIPTMTGGVGHDMLKRFYKYHFIPKSPKDTHITLVSRTIGPDRIIDEGIFSFTHTEEVDWLLPGIPPTGKKIQIPLVAVVCFRGDKICHEHIYWDQASVLVQAGLLKPDGLPVAGVETAMKVLDESRPSNALMRSWPESAGKPI